MVESFTVSTDGIEPRSRLDFWREMVANTFAPFEIVRSPSVEFYGRCTAAQIDDLLLAQTDFAPSSALRRTNMMRSAHFDGFMFVIPIEGVVKYADDGTSSIARPGDIAFYSYARSFDFHMERWSADGVGSQSPTGIRSINITIPRDVMTRVMSVAPKGVGSIIRAGQPSNPLIRNFFGGLVASGNLFDVATASRMARIGLDLLATGLAETLSEAPAQSVGTASLVYRARAFIEARLWDNDLNVGQVAAAMGLSARRLQMVFAEQQSSVAGWIWERRLQKAFQQLREPAFDRLSISEVGYSLGFVNVSHFTRRFTLRFGMTPTECRQEARLARSPVDR